MKIFTLKEIFPIFVLLIMVVASIVFWQSSCLPEKIPSHWNAAGEIDGYSSKTFAVLFYPGITIGIYFLMVLLPLFDPLKKNYQKFASPYFYIRLILVIFLAGLYFFSISAAYGSKIDIQYFIIPMISLLMVVFGAFMPQIKQNWFVGVRTPWTLNSQEVWEKTHQFAGKTFLAAGILSLLGIFFGELAFLVFIVVVLVGSLLPVGYSYWLYRKLGLFKK